MRDVLLGSTREQAAALRAATRAAATAFVAEQRARPPRSCARAPAAP